MKSAFEPTILRRLLGGETLTAAEAEALMDEVMDGRLGAASLGAALAAWQLRGPAPGEIAGAARSMRSHMVPVRAACADEAIDTCGTGGDGSGSFNVSTAAALAVAACGVPVAKHGNRSASSLCGSADVLEALGVNLELGPDALGRLLDEIGIAFLFAPRHHPAMRHAMPVRRELGVRTIFNVLGPLTNPAGARRQLVGVYSPALCDLLAPALRELGSEHVWIVHGRDGLDEISPTEATLVTALEDGRLHRFEIAPEDAGLARCRPEELSGGDAAGNAALLRRIAAGESGPRTDAVLLNAGSALVVAGRAADAREGVEIVREAIESGGMARLLDRLVEASNDLAASRSEQVQEEKS